MMSDVEEKDVSMSSGKSEAPSNSSKKLSRVAPKVVSAKCRKASEVRSTTGDDAGLCVADRFRLVRDVVARL